MWSLCAVCCDVVTVCCACSTVVRSGCLSWNTQEEKKRRKSWFSRQKKSSRPSRPSVQETVMYEEPPLSEDTHHAEVVEPQQTDVTVHSQGKQGEIIEEKLTLPTDGQVVNGNLSEPEDDENQWEELGGEGFQDVSTVQ